MSVLASLLEPELAALVAPEVVVPEPALPVVLAPLVVVPEPPLSVVPEPDVILVMPEPVAPLPPAAPLALPEERVGVAVVVCEPQATKAAMASEIPGVIASRRERMMGSPVGADQQQTGVSRSRHYADQDDGAPSAGLRNGVCRPSGPRETTHRKIRLSGDEGRTVLDEALAIPMVVNHPYLSPVVDVTTGAVLFIGHIADPTDAGSP